VFRIEPTVTLLNEGASGLGTLMAASSRPGAVRLLISQDDGAKGRIGSRVKDFPYRITTQ